MVKLTVVDSSVAYKWICSVDEGGVDAAGALLDAHETGTILLAAPDILHVELANVVRNSPYLDEDESVTIVEEIAHFAVELMPSTPTRLSRAVRLSYKHGLPVYDALFLQLAEELDCPLVTADRKAFAGIESPVEIRLV